MKNGQQNSLRVHKLESKQKLTLLVFLIILTVSFYAIDYNSDFGTDYEVYFSNGWFLTEGMLPYVDFWTHKTPLLPFVLAGWIGMFGHSIGAAVSFLIVITVAASYAVFELAKVLDTNRTAAVIAALCYVFFSAIHLLDPTRNGGIIIFASLFEILSVITLIAGLEKRKRLHLLTSGILVFLAFAIRQTSAIIFLSMLAIIIIANKNNSKHVARQIGILSLGSIIAVVVFILYFVINQVPFNIIWDQIYAFNIQYASGYAGPWTEWVTGWMSSLHNSKLHLVGIGVLAYFIGFCTGIVNRTGLKISDWILLIILISHMVVIFMQQKVQIFYVLQLMPEACIMTGITITNALGEKNIHSFKDILKNIFQKPFLAASLLLMLILPTKDELLHIYTTAQTPQEITNNKNHPIARIVRKLAPNADDRIWVLGFGDDIYMASGRLPAISHTNAARLQYALSPEDFDSWQDQFIEGEPKVVVSYLTRNWMEITKNEPYVDEGGRSKENLLEIVEFISTNMKWVPYELEIPEIYIWE